MFILNFLIIFLIKIYRLFLSPILGQNCRFSPTCSSYAIDALKVHGFFYGSYLTFRRLIKCNPLGSCGYDPVPPKKKIKFSFLNFIFKRD